MAKRGEDGLNDRQRAFVRQRRTRPEDPLAESARRAGYTGSYGTLAGAAQRLLRNPRVRVALLAPKRRRGRPSAEARTEEIRRRWMAVVRSPTASDSEKLDAAEKLAETIPDFYATPPEEPIFKATPKGTPPRTRSRGKAER